ncbi:MAG: Transposase IS200-family protein [Candidatus Daviesbacteria bacterium GW2011_GWA1_41_61]|uniref:Transposase IS200-family protein n=1 Tax=Candidatus Daviesbacteria bacterium GW2011_GWA2_40_9 TaxID=1618424 RepID=A0A0G0U7P6_9BACT|nr:MAG: Transposase IS200-family protein [Candidatus Daviesbacteria bacterium GW2011_GWC1_40_9]KKR83226.1 MAG: Transposase IS200-family protein [Candidatus Daviesbacteria bacterium GW2011_GWA2_40_9]KKR93571.1 MAG: Transposase IS200-family protein [Candidatus Daviesbacteria bacterium GW2011_GWB1_41_15]KKS14878.1 MAG: Transposase IS200-family protein [Candidatus Daviesbacteria bacterium GW2011_GWA1_41_61]
MASKNSIKVYSENTYYHLYNRGVEKRPIFQDDQDYAVFLSYLKEYLLPKNEEALRKKLSDPNTSYKEKYKILRLLRLNNFHGEIMLNAYCLMPNHFHFLIKQNSANSIDTFMNSLCLRYAKFFNTKYERVGRLFQDVYKAVMVDSEPQLLYLTSYIHQNPIKNQKKKSASPEVVWRACFSQPSSLPEYLGQKKTEWVHPEDILSYFSKTNHQLSYQAFVEQAEEILPIETITIDYV